MMTWPCVRNLLRGNHVLTMFWNRSRTSEENAYTPTARVLAVMDDVRLRLRLRLRSDRFRYVPSLTCRPLRSRASPVLSLTPSLPSTVIFILSPPCTPAHPGPTPLFPHTTPTFHQSVSLCARALAVSVALDRLPLIAHECVFCFVFSRRHRRYRRRYFILPYYSPIQLGSARGPLLPSPSPPAHTRYGLAPVRVLAPVHALTATWTEDAGGACGRDVCVRTGTLLQLRSALGTQLL